MLLEQMTSLGAVAAIVLPVVGLFAGSAAFLDSAESRFEFNRQARQAFSIVIDGGQDIKGGPGTDGSSYAYGLHSRKDAFNEPITDFQIHLTTNGITIKGDKVSPETFDCAAKDDPVGECKNHNDDFTLEGWFDKDESKLEDNHRSVNDRTVEVFMRLINPYLLKDGVTEQERLTESYRMIATLNREIGDP